MPLRLHGLPDAPSPEPNRPSTPDAENDVSLFKNLYTHFTNLNTTLDSTRHTILALYGDRQFLVELRATVPATGPLRDLHNALAEQCRRNIEDMRAHAVELENAVDELGNVLVAWLREQFESGGEEALQAMLEEVAGEEWWQLGA